MTDDGASTWWKDLTIENCDWRDNSPLAAGFADAMLLSLIRAHPMQSGKTKDDYERLKDAKLAIFGMKPRDDRRDKRDIPLLVVMAREYAADRNGAKLDAENGDIVWGDHDPKSCRFLKPLARDVIRIAKNNGHGFSPMVEPDSVVKRLVRKFSAQKQDLLKQVILLDGVETGYLIDWVTQIRNILGPVGIPAQIPKDPARDMKYLL
ncbi:hypothetical protein [Ruegeria atlantica]|uniref:Uncharacterized protein n=1 Tax=Ruegeria atlantica TaxID=81569 RepID=A0A0P1ESJ8_9RHOB|nr:hypothetical protein [Ruegeria atlantica]CUH45458.1 hypothetical protein RUM4293_04373 [Ruegeria atlantica]